MYFSKSFILLAAALLVSATPTLNGRSVGGDLVARQNGNNCQNFIGNCFQNGCAGAFTDPSQTIGTCTAGTFAGCPCDKCGSGDNFTGPCSGNGCNGIQGKCTAGTFQGCPCN